MMELVGVGISPGPFHWRPEISTSMGKETEQVRLTVVPDMMREGEEDVREMLTGATQRIHTSVKKNSYSALHNIPSIETADTLLVILHV